MGHIHFFTEDTPYKIGQKLLLKQWIKATVAAERFRVGEISIIVCSDAYLLAINTQYLRHDTYTDIVTFDNSDRDDTIAGDVFVSIDRVRENAVKFGVPERDELHRVIIHGILHLCGYGDKKKGEKALMTEKEDFYLERRN